MAEYLDPQDTDKKVSVNFAIQYPYDPDNRKVFGNIPAEVHKVMMGEAKARGLTIAEYLVSLAMFRREYEAEYKTELTKQRKESAADGELL